MHPTHRTSKGRTRRRRSHDSIVADEIGTCPVSEAPKQHHRACKESGYVRPGLTIKVPKLGIGGDND